MKRERSKGEEKRRRDDEISRPKQSTSQPSNLLNDHIFGTYAKGKSRERMGEIYPRANISHMTRGAYHCYIPSWTPVPAL